MKHKSLVLLAFVLTVSPLLADEKDRMLFTFDKPEAAKPWQTVNDGVMGGRSDGRFKSTKTRTWNSSAPCRWRITAALHQ